VLGECPNRDRIRDVLQEAADSEVRVWLDDAARQVHSLAHTRSFEVCEETVCVSRRAVLEAS
jgi:hypothetical protein